MSRIAIANANANLISSEDREAPYCYIRRRDGNGWVRGRAHHLQAYNAFMESLQHLPAERINDPVPVRVAHGDGGEFVATFRNGGQQIKKYEDEYGNHVEIIIMSASYAAFINRIVDHY